MPFMKAKDARRATPSLAPTEVGQGFRLECRTPVTGDTAPGTSTHRRSHHEATASSGAASPNWTDGMAGTLASHQRDRHKASP